MTRLQNLKIAALSTSCLLLLAGSAHAQTDSFDVSATPTTTATSAPANSWGDITLGIGGVSDSSAVFGRYNGMPDSGAGFLSSWNLGKRDAWDSGTTRYYSFTGSNVDVGFGGGFGPEATITLKAGDQGTWDAFATYDAMTYKATDNFTTALERDGTLAPGFLNVLTGLGTNGPFIGTSYTSAVAPGYFASIGSAKHYPGGLDVRSGGVGSTAGHILGAYTYPTPSPSNYSVYLASLNELVDNIGTRRDKGTIGAKYDIGDWIVGAVVSHEHKEGSLEQTMTTAGSNAGMMAFPMPINYDTDSYTATAAYDTDDLQAHFSYQFSNFIDHNADGFAFEGWNFTAVRTGAASPFTYASYESSGVYSLPPSNEAHTVKAEVGYNLDPETRLNGTFVYGLQLQNSAFVSPTLNQFALNNFGSYFNSNPTSLDGMVNTWFVNLAANTRPMKDLDIKVSYTLDSRDTQTSPMAIYGDPTDAITPTTINFTPAPVGSGCSTTPCAVPWQRLAVPESWTKQSVVLEANYRIDPTTRITVGYTFKDDHRTNAITRQAETNEESVKIYTTAIPDVVAWVGYVHSDRTASAPDFSLWTQQIMSDCISQTNAIFTPGTLGCQQVPFYEAPRTEDAVNGMATGSIGQNFSYSLFGKYSADEYHNPPAVYNSITNPAVGIYRDYTLQAGPDLDYRLDKDTDFHFFYTFLRDYRAMNALNNLGTTYNVISTYDIHTAGVGVTWRCTDKLKFAADYNYSYGGEGFNQGGSWGSQAAGDPLLNTRSSIHQVKVHATYEYSEATSIYVGYQFDSLFMSDWALVGASTGQVVTGDVAPMYNVSTVMAGLTLKL